MSTDQFARMTKTEAERFMLRGIGARYKKMGEMEDYTRAEISRMVGSRPVIDFGCGKGAAAKYYRPLQYLGIDCSRQLIQLARKDHPEYEFHVGRVQKPPTYDVPGEKWPCGIMQAVLEHLPSEEAVAAYEAARDACKTLFIAWATPPAMVYQDRPYKGELAEPMHTYQHLRPSFNGVAFEERSGNFVIWIVE